jgi:hypothetical protein
LTDEELLEHMCQVNEAQARTWLFSMIDTLTHNQLTRMCVTLWAIWHARRKAIHEDSFQSPLSTHCFIDSFIRELDQMKKPKPARWIPPPPGMAKLNVDAGVSRSGSCGSVAVVARSEAGEYLGASAVLFHGLVDPEILEALAVREGLNLAQDLKLPRMMIASDCLRVVNALHEANLGVYSHIISEIQFGARGFVEAMFSHEGRSSNKEAHNLAQLVLSLQVGRHVWFINPPEGVCIPRTLI